MDEDRQEDDIEPNDSLNGLPGWVSKVTVLIVALFVGGGVTYAFLPREENTPNPPTTLTVPVDGLDPGKAPDRHIEVPAVALKQAAPTLEDQLRDEAPAVAPDVDIQSAQQAAKEIQRTKEPLSTAGATSGFKGCQTSFVRNQSSRRGVRPVMQTLHYTVSPNRPGRSDVNATVAFFNRSSSQASSHFIIDSEGNCAYIVPIEAKAWTQAAGNPFSVSYEIIATGKEPNYLGALGIAKLRSVMREVSQRTGIPMRRGHVSSCQPTTTGIVEHRDWGLCGGGHVDIRPFAIDSIVKQVITSSCDRACDLKRRHRATHMELHTRHCAPKAETKSDACQMLWNRNRALHRAAEREKIKL